MSQAKQSVAILMRGMIRLYQLLLSPVMTPSCRFLPSCSEYASEAIARHGACHGGMLTLKRLARCHPWGGCGLDPVPETREKPRAKKVNF